MFKWIFILLFFISFLSGQVNVITVPQTHEWIIIYDGILGNNGDGLDTTNAFSAWKWSGSITLAIKIDSTGYGTQHDSCITPYLQTKRKGNDWTGYYNDSSIAMDTINRAIVNGSVNINLLYEISYIPPIDSLRLIFQNGVGDSIGFKVEMGGQ